MQLAVARRLAWRRMIASRAKLSLWLGVSALVFTFTVVKGMQDPDFFFHVNTGRLIAATGTVPSTDSFTFTWSGRPWTPHEWLGALWLYALDHWIGPVGSTLVFGLFPVATLGVMTHALRVRAIALAGPLMLSGMALAPFVTLRPQAISWLGLAILVAFLLRLRTPSTALWLIPGFALWANLHGLYVIGLGIVAVYALTSRSRPILAIALACLLATTLTPAGVEGLMYSLRYLEPGDWGLTHIPEWQSPDFHEPALWPVLGIIVALMAVGLHGPRWLVIVAVLSVMGALFSMRGIPVAAVVTFPVLVLGIDRRRLPRLRPDRRAVAATSSLLVGLLTVAIMQPWSVLPLRERARLFPVAATDVVLDLDADARVFTSYYWGGYVGWRLYDSGGRVFVDGRNDMFDQSILEDYTRTINAEPGWTDVLDRYHVDVLIVPPGRLSAAATDWIEAYSDEDAVVLVRPLFGQALSR